MLLEGEMEFTYKHSVFSLTLVLAALSVMRIPRAGGLPAALFVVSQKAARSGSQNVPAVVFRKASLIKFPATVDCNSPAHWDGDTMFVFNSAPPFRSSGVEVTQLGPASPALFNSEANGERWIEATYKAEQGKLYGWYHNEPHRVCSANKDLTAPRIGAVVSTDNGAHWKDLGFILEAPPNSLECRTQNHYFAGGNGDFSVILDNKKDYFYFFISTYNKQVSEQGVSVARMRYTDRDAPVNKAWKWHMGSWKEPGIGGHVSPIFPVGIDWNRRDADAFWGPSIHWNTHLNQYVILLNRAIDKDWKQEGVYVSFNPDVSVPRAWSMPRKIMDRSEIVAVPGMESGWYPQVIGLDSRNHETDKYAGRVARFFVHGKSIWEAVFLNPGDE
jgi:hypothetical protein